MDAAGRSLLESLKALEGAGLHVCSEQAEGVPSRLQAIRAAYGYEPEVKYTVPMSSGNPMDELDRLWHYEALNSSIYSDDGRILLGIPGPGSSE